MKIQILTLTSILTFNLFLYGATSKESVENLYQEIAKLKATDKELTEWMRDVKAINSKVKNETISVEKGTFELCKKGIELYEMGGLSLMDARKMVSSLFSSRHMMNRKDTEFIDGRALAILKELQAKHPKEPDLYLLETYSTDLSTPAEIANANAALKKCLELDPKHKRCREMLEAK